jgi:hypothetical protein
MSAPLGHATGLRARPPLSLDGIDAQGLLAALGSVEGRRVGLVGGVGDLAPSLLAAGASVLHAVDEPLRALAEARRAALRALPVQSTRSYLGFGHFGRRVWFAHYLRPHLPEDVARVWDAQEQLVREGLEGAGAWEQSWRRAAPWLHAPDPLRRAGRAAAALQVAGTLREAPPLPALRALAQRLERLRKAPEGGHARRLLGVGGPEDVPEWLRADVYPRAQARVDAWRCVPRVADPEAAELDLIVELHAAAPAAWSAPRRIRYAWKGSTPLADASVGALYRSEGRQG